MLIEFRKYFFERETDVENGDKKLNKSNKFVRVLVVIYIIFLFSLIFYNFFRGESKYVFSSGLITVLMIITIVIFSEVFDNMSLGRLLSLSRDVKEKEETIEEVKQENVILRENVISLANVVSQKQTNQTYIGFDHEIFKSLGVVKTDKNDEENEDYTELQNGMTDNLEMNPINSARQELRSNVNSREITKKIEKLALEKFLSDQNISPYEVINDVKFSSGFEEADPISSESEKYSAYYKLPDKEIFINVRRAEYLGLSVFYRTYKSLAQLKFYEELKKIKAEMILVITDYPEEYRRIDRDNQDRMVNRFILRLQPAISNHLLKIEVIKITEEEIKSILEESTSGD